ncbi:MAG: VWA domain-containing protein [Solirubrobacteraceae bacterium]|jgi:VWA domain-containing protein
MTLLTPLGGLVALAALIPLAAFVAGRGRVAAVRRALGLTPPPRSSTARQALAVAAIAVLGLAAAQPALSDVATARTRTNVEVLFVLDTSLSMAASASANSPTRLERAVAAATRLRATIPTVPSGVATFTDRVLPDLLPVTDVAAFDSVLTQAVAIENPPPIETDIVRDTDYAALQDIGTGNYFEPGVTRRVVVLLTDGESLPFNTSEIASQLPPALGYRFLAIRFWAADEGVYNPNGRRQPGYHPYAAGKVLLAQLAASLGGRSYEEAELGEAADYLHQIIGSGPTTTTRRSASVRTLAPFVAALAVLLLMLALAPTPSDLRGRRALRWLWGEPAAKAESVRGT